HPVVRDEIGRIEDRRVVSYGADAQADVRLADVKLEGGMSRFRVVIRGRDGKAAQEIGDLVLPMPGHHNALNATAAIAVAHELGVPHDRIRKALANFGGVKRRFTRTGEWNGVTVFDDYAHHPVEIAAVLAAARASTKGKVIAVMQPHRYTRLRDLFDQFCSCFKDADHVIIAPVYPAGESPIQGIDREALVKGARARGHRHVVALDAPEQLAGLVRKIVKPGDYVVCLGAGSITQWAQALPGELAALAAKDCA
ncbi:MAG: cyanophycin synthetase, partial [Xanthobacteraceae bacterium]|nr:cyanophycin synthetase [Xanthobacteraceae bacterium]